METQTWAEEGPFCVVPSKLCCSEMGQLTEESQNLFFSETHMILLFSSAEQLGAQWTATITGSTVGQPPSLEQWTATITESAVKQLPSLEEV